jgi:hypothetical protein
MVDGRSVSGVIHLRIFGWPVCGAETRRGVGLDKKGAVTCPACCAEMERKGVSA